MTRTALEGFGKSLLASDEVVIEATANSIGVSRVLAPFVARVIIANPLQVKAIAQVTKNTEKSMPARSRAYMRPATCRTSGRLTRDRAQAQAGGGVTRSCGIARGLRTGCIRSCART
jgi:hypothetical protein